MLCSAKELGLGEDHSGILDLDPATELGADVREVLGLDDVIFDLAITPNRPDAMCIVGVARELAAHFSLDFTVPEPVAARRRLGRERHHGGGRGRGALPPLPRPGRPGHDGPVARVDGAAPGEGGHAADQQRGRRHQLRAARAQPAAARVRPLPARRARHRRPARRRRRDDDDPRRRRARAHPRGPADLRRRAPAPGHRRDHGRVDVGGVRRHHRDPPGVGLLRAHGHRPQLQAAEAAQRVERALRARHRPRRGRAQRRTGDGAPRRGGGRPGRGRRVRRVPGTGRADAHPPARAAA